jgi:hypothetical protein
MKTRPFVDEGASAIKAGAKLSALDCCTPNACFRERRQQVSTMLLVRGRNVRFKVEGQGPVATLCGSWECPLEG